FAVAQFSAPPYDRRHSGDTPAASHDAIAARSAAVISVTLPGGIALDHAALRPIRGALRQTCSAVSRRIAFGAAASVGHTGSAAWHMLQRVLTMRMTSVKSPGGDFPALPVRSPLAPASRGPAADRSAIA